MRKMLISAVMLVLTAISLHAQTSSSEELNRRIVAQRAFEAVVWGMPIDERGMVYSYAFIGLKRLGAGQFYSISIRDKDGDSFDGAKTYRLNVPPNVPVDQYWSVTAYDRDTHALIKNMPRASRSSQIPGMQKNSDGSIDVYFGAKAPAGKESNWVHTDPARKFELMARFYGPKKEFFDKAWKLPDVEKMDATSGTVGRP